MKQKVAWAESLGAALVSVNYRLTTPDSGVQWPDHGQDVAAAVAWVQQNGPAQGLDPTQLTLIGHSAGAHLVAIVATDQALLTTAGADPAKVSCVVALDFSFDLARAPADKMIADAFGTDPQVIASASPNVQIERNGAPSARFLIATRGGRSRVADAQAFVDLVNTSGGSAELVDATPYTHNQVSTQLGDADDTLVTPAVSEFVQSCN
jgi:acetyl esterase/lipase